jgi:UV DNA damage endonuclease
LKIGYPSINLAIDRRIGKPFTVLSRKRDRIMIEARRNIEELRQILAFNVENNLLFFRIRPDLIPLASDPKLNIEWQKEFAADLKDIGRFIKSHNIRINIHADLFTMINHPDESQLNQSIRDLYYQAELIDMMGLDQTAKLQVHAGERFKQDKGGSIGSFIERFKVLDDIIKKRMVIENENVLCTFKDCMDIHIMTGLPILPDVLHHELSGGSDGIHKVLELAAETWQVCDGPMMVDYSSQDPGRMSGKHSQSINLEHFRAFIYATKDMNFDMMMELKDRENSALVALRELQSDPRFIRGLKETVPPECLE